MKVEEIMTTDAKFAEVPGERAELLDLMNEHKVDGLPVVKKGTRKIVGMITKTDLLKKPGENQIALLMSRNPITVPPDTSVTDVVRLLIDNGIRRIPVIDKDTCVGIVTVADIVWKAIPKMDLPNPIKSYVKRDVIAVWDGTPLPVAYTIMDLARTRVLHVLNGSGELCGIVSEVDMFSHSEVISKNKVSSMQATSEGTDWSWDTEDILYIAKKELKLPQKPISEIMISDVITVVEQVTVSECAAKMKKFDIDQIPVLNAEGRLSGLIRDRDLLRVFLE
ncbi:MAG: CBS domain-containing protein [Candidatus Hodarchaeota archaeon]